MKRYVLTLLLTACVVFVSYAQRRTTGTSRDPEAVGSNTSDRPSRVQETKKDNPPPAQEHESDLGSVVCILILGDSPSQSPDEDGNRRIDTEEDESSEVILHDSVVSPGGSGFDFSAGEVGNFGGKDIDVFLSKAGDAAEFVVGPDADIQNLGPVSFQKFESTPKEWSPAHRVEAEAGNTYVVWTWDNQYYKFTVNLLSDEQVSLQWAKIDGGIRLASNVDLRDGVHHLKKSRFGR